VPEATEGILGESSAGTESIVIEPPLTSAGESTDVPLLQPAETAVDAPTSSEVDVVSGVVGGAGPSSPQPATTVAEEVPVPS
jgi:hypothetical protein